MALRRRGVQPLELPAPPGPFALTDQAEHAGGVRGLEEIDGEQNEPGGEWNKTLLNDFGAPVWRLSWSVMGNVLAVSDANNMVTVWKESVDGRWNQISATE